MCRKFLSVIFAVLVIIVFSACSSKQTGKFLGLKAPYTRIQVLEGAYLPLADFRGKTVVLIFWAQWCAKSNQLLQDLNNFAVGRTANNVFLLVSVDRLEDLAKLKARLNSLSNTNFVYGFSGNAEHDEAYLAFQAQELPQVYVINPNGMVIGEGQGLDIVKKLVK